MVLRSLVVFKLSGDMYAIFDVPPSLIAIDEMATTTPVIIILQDHRIKGTLNNQKTNHLYRYT